MKNFFYALLGLFFCQSLTAQEPVRELVPLPDSLRPEMPLLFEPGLELPLIQDEMILRTDFKFKPEIPDLDFSRYLDNRWRIGYHSFSGDNPFFSNMSTFPYQRFFFPLTTEGLVFNQATYQVSDKIVVGGNSFGINSIFRSSIPRFGPDSYDFRGASLFLEYKVSKNFRIGGGFSVTNQPRHP